MTDTKKFTLEEAVQELRKPEARVSDEAFGRAWYHVFTRLDVPANSAITELFAEVPLYAIERTEGLTPEAKRYLEARVALKTEKGKRLFNAPDDAIDPISKEDRLRETELLKETELYFEYLTSLPRFRERALKYADKLIDRQARDNTKSYESLLEVYTGLCFGVFDNPEDIEFNPCIRGIIFSEVKNALIECAKKDGERRLHSVSHHYSNGVIVLSKNPTLEIFSIEEPIRQKMMQYFAGIVEERRSQYKAP